jgi:hypothetical protein
VPKGLWASRWLVDTSTSWGHNFHIQSPFGVHSSLLEISKDYNVVACPECVDNKPRPLNFPENIV